MPCFNSLYHNLYLIKDLSQLNLDILVKVGTNAYVQTDYLACFSDSKCFWLVSKMLECSNKEPKNYYMVWLPMRSIGHGFGPLGGIT